MTYATTAAALALIGYNGDLTGTTVPTFAEAGAMNAAVNAEIDAAVAMNGLAVPVTTPAWLAGYLASVNTWGLAARILYVRFQDKDGPNSNKAAEEWQRMYREALAGLRKGEGLTAGSGSAVLPQSYTTLYPTEAATPTDIGANAVPTLTPGTMVW